MSDRGVTAVLTQPIDLEALVRELQASTPLTQLSNMEARTVFELMEQRGYQITRRPVY